ncbi:MAG: fumarylacetoacetate hydrolase family protein [Proteobacteria bacterium]|jgi:2-keto-4-pentenoate hydratase/2-oxohepta-3-ene-1,7-dioic acid hydratase in catechol pathway|nr:fumarylacetoacetate hydrolase family protein [Pseudomonadota bacterium]
MAKWIRFKRQSSTPNSAPVEFGQLIDDDSEAPGQVTVHTGDLFEGSKSTDEILQVNNLDLLTPCWPSKMIGLWNNVRSAAEKKGLAIPEEPLYFLKPSNCYLPHQGEIQRPDYYDGRIIYEGELGVVIGKTCRNVSESDAGDYIFGYTCVNDVTALTLIEKDPTFPQWCRAKSMDTFGAFGPSICTEIDADQLTVQTIYRNKVMQNYPISDLIFSPHQLVSLLSQDMTLFPGDLIACGTGDGILPIKPGKTVEVQIEGLDSLSNTMSA